jgi:hypothetical protein
VSGQTRCGSPELGPGVQNSDFNSSMFEHRAGHHGKKYKIRKKFALTKKIKRREKPEL